MRHTNTINILYKVICVLSTPCLEFVYMLYTSYAHLVYTIHTSHLLTVYTLSTFCPHFVYILSTPFLHLVYICVLFAHFLLVPILLMLSTLHLHEISFMCIVSLSVCCLHVIMYVHNSSSLQRSQ